MRKAGVFSILFVVVLFAVAIIAEAQQPTKIPMIGILAGGSPGSARLDSFRREFGKLGYVEGKNIAFEFRYADDKLDRLPSFAAELVRLKVDVIVTPGANDTRAAKNATRTIPIVFLGTVSDPVSLGLVDSLASPGGNLTGFTSLGGGWLENSLSYSRRLFPSSPEWRCCGIRRMRAQRKYGKKANRQQRNSVCNFIPWR